MKEAKNLWMIGLGLLIIAIMVLLFSSLASDGCCHTDFCNRISDETFKWAEENDFTICCGSTCVDACRHFLKENSITNFDCRSICPSQDDMKCNYEWMPER